MYFFLVYVYYYILTYVLSYSITLIRNYRIRYKFQMRYICIRRKYNTCIFRSHRILTKSLVSILCYIPFYNTSMRNGSSKFCEKINLDAQIRALLKRGKKISEGKIFRYDPPTVSSVYFPMSR